MSPWFYRLAARAAALVALSLILVLPLRAGYAEHPRIYLTPERIARISSLHHAGDSYEWNKLLLCAARTDMDGARAKALVYAITGDESWAAGAIEIMQNEMIDHPVMTVSFNSVGSKFNAWALTFDWVYRSPQFTDELKQQVIDYVNAVPMEGSGKWNWYPDLSYFNGVAKILWGPPLWGLATWGDNPEAAVYVDNGYENRWRYLRNALGFGPENLAVARGGCMPQGMDYGSGTLAHIFHYLEAVRTATGEDLYDEAPALREFLGYFAKSYYYTDEFIRRPEHGHNAHKEGAYLPSAITALLIGMDRYRDTQEGRWAAWWASSIDGAAYYPGNSYRYHATDDVIFSDPTIEQESPFFEPLSYFAPGNGMIIARSDWTAGAAEPRSFATFRAGNWTWFNQNQWDQGNFCLFSHGEDLIVDGGLYDGAGGGSVRNYHHQTVAHNSITVKDPEQTKGWYFYAWSDPGYENSGGQNVPYRETLPDAPLDGREKDSYWPESQPLYLHDMSDLLRHADSPRYTYAFADLTNAYANARWEEDYAADKLAQVDYRPKVDEVTRHWLYLRAEPGAEAEYIVTYDRVRSVDASFEKKSLLHFVGEPTFPGGAIVDSEVPGHVETWAADRFEMNIGGAVLHGAVLLPEDPQIRRVGGEGYEAWVNGTNWNSFPDDDVSLGGLWRVEIMPGEARLTDRFLTVLHPDWAGSAAPAAARIEGEGVTGALLDGWALVFATEADLPAEAFYEIADSGLRRHLIFGAAPSQSYRIYREGDSAPFAVVAASDAGVLEFESRKAGGHRVVAGDDPVDAVPPTGSVQIAGGDCLGEAAVTLLIEAIDGESNMADGAMRLSNDGVNWTDPLPYEETWNWTLAPGDGPRRVYALFADAAGNWSVEPAVDTAFVDTTPPVASFSIAEELVTEPVVNLDCSAIEFGCGGERLWMSFSNDGISWSIAEPLASTRMWNLHTPFGAGVYRVYARFGDLLGNWSEPWLSDQVLYEPTSIDQSPPLFSLFFPADGETGVPLDAWPACLVSDGQSGVNPDSLRLWLDDEELDLKQQPFFGGGYYVVAPRDGLLEPMRTYTIRIRALDLAVPPNVGEHEWSFTTGDAVAGGGPRHAPLPLRVSEGPTGAIDVAWQLERGSDYLGYQVSYGLWPDGEEVRLAAGLTVGARIENLPAGDYWVGIRGLGVRGEFTQLQRHPFPIHLSETVADPGIPVLRLSGEPNPFRVGTSLRFSIPANGKIWLEVFDIRGRAVRTLVDGESLSAGEHARAWDGRDGKGAPLGSGIYFTRLRSEAGVVTGKITLLR